MSADEHWMRRCLQLALNGSGQVAPNPMVGAILVQGERIIAEGWHGFHGGPHAEVNCLRAFGEGAIPDDATLYVNLEPCAHHGLTPPCIDLLIQRGVKSLVVGSTDPNPLTRGKGIARAREAGMHVRVDIQHDDCRWLNRRFITSFVERRPYVVLKWAQSADGFLDRHPRNERNVQRISSAATDVVVHRWRSEEQAILVGSRTVINDNPRLNVRHAIGRQPLRVIVDRQGVMPTDSHVFDNSAPTLVLGGAQRKELRCDQVVLRSDEDPIAVLFSELHRRSVRSMLVEGGAELLGHFIGSDRWDEARVITGPVVFGDGTRAPVLGTSPVHEEANAIDRIAFHVRKPTVSASWPN
jgi:diaminohydroxyphosphoribosylaminopyrimidine deaminase / 5-amino-6-(5-phosphoribosylamino)uracil reductase